jgi:hypothetical protein
MAVEENDRNTCSMEDVRNAASVTAARDLVDQGLAKLRMLRLGGPRSNEPDNTGVVVRVPSRIDKWSGR